MKKRRGGRPRVLKSFQTFIPTIMHTVVKDMTLQE